MQADTHTFTPKYALAHNQADVLFVSLPKPIKQTHIRMHLHIIFDSADYVDAITPPSWSTFPEESLDLCIAHPNAGEHELPVWVGDDVGCAFPPERTATRCMRQCQILLSYEHAPVRLFRGRLPLSLLASVSV